MNIIKSFADLHANVLELERERQKALIGKGRRYKALIAGGKVFYPYLADGAIAFGPSRFLGYCGNTIRDHNKKKSVSERDGKKTNPKISAILSVWYSRTIKNAVVDDLEAEFQAFCEEIEVEPHKVTRSYWTTPEVRTWLDTRAEGARGDVKTRKMERAIQKADKPTRAAMIKARIGQGRFRNAVLERYHACAVTNLADPALLVASHIKPWRDCHDHADQCLDSDNSLLLSPVWDALFDKGFVSFSDDGALLLSAKLSGDTRSALNVPDALDIALIRTRRARGFVRLHQRRSRSWTGRRNSRHSRLSRKLHPRPDGSARQEAGDRPGGGGVFELRRRRRSLLIRQCQTRTDAGESCPCHERNADRMGWVRQGGEGFD